ncbi:MAG: hypothetical protein IJZ08_00525 [Clostridia bacterium]|nr:hypothetical protein [Clostridia bacterium]
MICTFFGHRDTPDGVRDLLRDILVNLIEEGAETFYLGNQGRFDDMALGILKKLKVVYPHIRYAVVLAYMPESTRGFSAANTETVYPDGLENTPPRYAIDKRNRWMLAQADTVVTYVTHDIGGAAKYKRIAERKRKRVINLAD